MNKTSDNVRENPTVISDSGRIRIGSISPAFPPVRGCPRNVSDTGKVRIGNMSPALPLMRPLVSSRPVTVSDTGEVRIGDCIVAGSLGSTADEPKIRIAAVSPKFAPVRSR